MMLSVFGFLAGLTAGLIDSMAGGGGLLTLPFLTLALGAGAQAIATNKIVGLSGAVMALFIYRRKDRSSLKMAWVFSAAILVGSFIGSGLTARLPKELFPVLLLLTIPTILFFVLKKSLWLHADTDTLQIKPKIPIRNVLIAGFACGLYDGGWGPGGGTFMLVSLLWAARMPLLMALTASKLANTCSAGIALTHFLWIDRTLVHWPIGILVAMGMGTGAMIGARIASDRLSRIVRPALVLISLGLLLSTLIRHISDIKNLFSS